MIIVTYFDHLLLLNETCWRSRTLSLLASNNPIPSAVSPNRDLVIPRRSPGGYMTHQNDGETADTSYLCQSLHDGETADTSYL